MAQAQHQELLGFPTNLGSGGDNTPITRSELNDILNRWKWQISQLNLKSGMTQYLTGSQGYFVGFTKNITGIADNTAVFAIGNPAGKYFSYDGTNLNLSGGTFALDTNGQMFQVCYGFQSGLCTDGNAVTFNQTYQNPPFIWFGPGGLTYSSALGSAASQSQIFTPNNTTGTGFTPYLKLQSLPTTTAQSINFAGLPAANSNATLNTTTAFDNNYTYNFSVQAIPGHTTITATLAYSLTGISPYTTLANINHSNITGGFATWGPNSFTYPISGMVASTSVLRISISNGGANTFISSGATGTYTSATGGTTVTATPSGSGSVRWYAIAAPS